MLQGCVERLLQPMTHKERPVLGVLERRRRGEKSTWCSARLLGTWPGVVLVRCSLASPCPGLPRLEFLLAPKEPSSHPIFTPFSSCFFWSRDCTCHCHCCCYCHLLLLTPACSTAPPPHSSFSTTPRSHSPGCHSAAAGFLHTLTSPLHQFHPHWFEGHWTRRHDPN